MEINLFDKKLKKIKQKQRLKFLLFQIFLAVIFGLSLAMIGLSSYSMMVANKNKGLEVKIADTKIKIESMKEVESKQVYLNSKLSSFKELIVSHEKHQAITETVFAVIPPRTTLRGFEVSEDGVITLGGTVPDFPTLILLFDKIKNPGTTRLPIAKAEVSKISFSQGGAISFLVHLTLKINQS